MQMNRWMRIAGWIVVGLTSLFFIQSGLQKLLGTEQIIDHFDALGYPDWSRIVIGIAEILGAVLLGWPRLTVWAAAALGVLMIGAVASEWLAGQGVAAVLIPGQWLILLVLIAGMRYKLVIRPKIRAKANETEVSGH
jgi:uncharacterized membrane protein YphA (DoxX/SURF4 family)